MTLTATEAPEAPPLSPPPAPVLSADLVRIKYGVWLIGAAFVLLGVVFGIGVYFHFSAPRNSFLWMILVLLLTFAAQRVSATVVGYEFSGFFGMLVATPLGYLIQLRFRGPPSMVTFLPSFWLLVPGSLGLLSVAHMLSDREAGLEGLSAAVFILASIAIGTLLGASLYKWLTEFFNVWQLQIGRVRGYFRDKRRR